MDEMVNSVSSQIQRAINEVINNQVLPQIQNVVMAGSGRETRRGWEAPLERPEISTGVCRNQNAKAHLRSEQDDEQHIGELLNRNVHDKVGLHNRRRIPKFYLLWPPLVSMTLTSV